MMSGAVIMGRMARRRLPAVGTRNLAEMPGNRSLIELVRFTLDDRDGILGTFAEACPQPVAEIISGKDRFPVDDPDGTFRT